MARATPSLKLDRVEMSLLREVSDTLRWSSGLELRPARLVGVGDHGGRWDWR